MLGNKYQAEAMVTNDRKHTSRLVSKIDSRDINTPELINACLGLAGETGEVGSILNRWCCVGEVSYEHLKKELGDILWYVALACDSLGANMDDIIKVDPCDKCSDTAENAMYFVNCAHFSISKNVGGINDIVKKWIFHEHDLDMYGIFKSLIGIIDGVSLAGCKIGANVSDIMQMNVDKLRSRYKGTFTVEESKHRKAGDI